MNLDTVTLWTIDELRDQVATALAVGYNGVPSGRVRDVPDLRTIRYYTTLGLLDRPIEMRGRTALYGQKHRLQLVAIKRLQALGHSLLEIQGRLIGRSDSTLGKKSTTGRERNFWRVPIEPAADVVRETVVDPRSASLRSVQEIDLGADVTVSLSALRPIDHEDLRVIHLAAAPLMEFLKLRGLIPNESGDER